MRWGGQPVLIVSFFTNERFTHMHFFIGFFTVLLILVSLFMILVILMQRPRSDGGLGAALGGGGAAESAFGAETSSILTKTTIYCVIFFFVASFGLYLAHMQVRHSPVTDLRTLPEIREGEPEDLPLVPPGDVSPDDAEEDARDVQEEAAAEPDESAAEPDGEDPSEEEKL